LTTLGVVIGTFILAVSLSIGGGVEAVGLREFRRHDQMRQIEVHSGFGAREKQIPPAQRESKGDMRDAKRERIRKAMIRWWSRKNVVRPTVPLTEDRIKALAAIDHVQAVTPFIFQGCRAFLQGHEWEVTSGASPAPNKHLQ